MHNVKFPKILQPFRCDDLVRLGKSNDGGYIINKFDIDKTDNLISFGIGQDWSFESDFLEIRNCDLIAYDENVDISKKDYSEFFQQNRKHFKTNISNDNIQDILNLNNIFLKCDIEGYEYELFSMLINNSHKFTGIVLEIHNINNNIQEIFNFVSKIHLRLVHVHVNNYFYYKTENVNVPDILEISLTSSNNIKYDCNLELPHSLDMVNNPNDSEFKITF